MLYTLNLCIKVLKQNLFSLVYIISPTEGACLQKIKVSKKWSVNVNTITFCHPSDPSMMLVACAGKGDFELAAWKITKTKSTKLIRFGGISSSKFRISSKSQLKPFQFSAYSRFNAKLLWLCFLCNWNRHSSLVNGKYRRVEKGGTGPTW